MYITRLLEKDTVLSEEERIFRKEKFIKNAKLFHNNKFDYSRVNFVKVTVPVEVICPKHGGFMVRPVDHIKKDAKYSGGCKKCAIEKRSNGMKISLEEFKRRVSKLPKGASEPLYDEYDGISKKMSYICPIHGEWSVEPYRFLRRDGKCPKCGVIEGGIKNRMDSRRFIRMANKIHNNKYNYEFVHYIDTETPVVIVCPIHGDFLQTPHGHLAGKGCRACGYKKAELDSRSNTEEFIRKAIMVHSNKYDYSHVNYINNKTPVNVVCPEHGEFKIRPDMHLNGSGCSLCNMTTGERVVYTILKKFNISFKYNYMFGNGQYRYDFYLNELDILIEYDGQQHFELLSNHTQTELMLTKYRDQRKDILAERFGVPLIRIKYDIENVEEYLINNLAKYYPYYVDGVFLRNMYNVIFKLKLPLETKNEELEKYKTVNLIGKTN